jgi:pimeloyl-ACP methyl ester carboxylesterase
VVVGHSLGSVIAYDVLTGPDAPVVDALITLGSPLGLSEVQEALAPPWTSFDGWPARCLPRGPWTNIADRLDPVCGADPSIAGDFRRAGSRVVVDDLVHNGGSWRHSVTKYLGQPRLRLALAEALAEH